MEKWDIGLLGVFFLTHKLQKFKNENIPFRINIPTFHYSMYEAKAPGLNKSILFQKVVQFPRCLIISD
jgi:hypothetical protein